MSNTNSIQLFNYEEHAVRTVTINGEAWFVAKDVCDILDIKNVTQAVQSLEANERSMFCIGRQGEVNIVNEPGLYRLIFRSNKPEAKAFQDWVYHEVLPALHHTGSYSSKKGLPPRSLKDAEPIISKAVRCKTKADCQEVRALDRVFQNIYGCSILEIAEIQLEVPEPRHNKREAQLWEHIVSTFAPDEWFSISELMQTLNEVHLCIRQVRRYLAEFVSNKQLKRRGNLKGTEYTRKRS